MCGRCCNTLKPATIMPQRQPIDDATSPVHTLPALAFTDAVVDYALRLYVHGMSDSKDPDPTCDNSVIDKRMRLATRHLVRGFMDAHKNKCVDPLSILGSQTHSLQTI